MVVARSIIIQVPIYALLTFWLFLGRGRFASDRGVCIQCSLFPASLDCAHKAAGVAISWKLRSSVYKQAIGFGTSTFCYWECLFICLLRLEEPTNSLLETSRFPVLIVALALYGAFRFAQFLITGALVEV